jgi:hypothetical protein
LPFILLVALGVALPAAAGDMYGTGDVAQDGTGAGPHERSAPAGTPVVDGPYPGNAVPDTGKAAPGDAAAYLRIYYGRAASGSMPADPPAAKGRAIGPPRNRAAARADESVAQRSRGHTRAVQAGLLAAGHDPGPLDGWMGPKTRGAIRAFQRRHGLYEDGEIGGGLIEALLDALGSAPRAPPRLPSNAHRIPFLDDWACDRGYRRNGNRCDRMEVPAHASPGLLGDSWVCDHGYRRAGTRCEKVVVPFNARPAPDILGDGWECDRGYRRVGRQCDRVPVPRNSTRDRHGEGWTCNRGYRQAGNWCIRQSIPRRAPTCCGIRPRP